MSIAFNPKDSGISTDVITRIRNTISGNWALINIFQKSGQPDLEKYIVRERASYGHQLGILLSAVEYLKNTSEHIDHNAKPIRELDHLIADINLAKRKFSPNSEVNLYQQLEEIAEDNPQQLKRIKSYIDELFTRNSLGQ